MTTTRDAIEKSYLVLATVGGKNLLARRDVLTRPHQDLTRPARYAVIPCSVVFGRSAGLPTPAPAAKKRRKQLGS